MTGLLEDLAILDLSDECTAFAGKLLAELGAHVIRVEDTAGDALRSRSPFLHDVPGTERSLAHILYNAGKRSVALNLGAPAAWDVVEAISNRVEAVLFPLEQRDGHAALKRTLLAEPAGPGIVDVVFRREDPEAVATDLIATAAGGLLIVNGFPDDPPNYPAGNLAYKETSLAAAHAALALAIERRRGRRAGSVTVSLQEAVNFTTLQTSNANWWHWQGRVPSRHTPLTSFTTYRAADGQWVSFTVHPPNWPRYADWVRTDLGTDELCGPEWEDAVFRATRFRHLAGFTQRLCDRYSRDELLEQGQRRGLLLLPVNTIADIAADPHLQDRGFLQQVQHPALGSSLALPRSSFLSSLHETAAARAPSLGEHTEQILRDVAQLPQPDIDRLFESGVVAGPRVASAASDTSDTKPAPAPTPGLFHSSAPERQPLAGVRVLDFCWAIAGALGTRLLADLGADVIKVESEYRLDPIRQIGVQPLGESSLNTNGQYNDVNPNKRALTVNVNTPEGIDIVRRLAATADVVTSNYTPDRLDRWGLGYEDLRAIKPDIIVANWAVMGTHGPHKDWRSYGSGIVAMCGLAHLTGFPGRSPIGLGTLHTDFTVPYFAAAQVMAALLHRERTGEGQFMEIAQYEASVHLLDTELVEYLNNGADPPRLGNRSPRMAPHGVFPAAGEDTWIAIACRDDADWAALCGVTGVPHLPGRQRFDRLDEIETALSAWTSTRDASEATALLQAAGVPASPAEDLIDLLERDPGMVNDYRHVPLPSGVTAIVQEEPITWDGERLPIRRAPLWNEHTDEILRLELNLPAETIEDYAARGVLY
jgi:crotonobetainyl-CoA:carnitine CoA-transferase CaiB-like acyl-CoA transferase